MLNDRKRDVDPSAIESDLKVLANNSETLNRLTDELTKHVEQIESTINALNLGLRASVIAECASDEEGLWTHYVRLWYDKTDGKWGLAIDEFDQNEQDPDRWFGHKSWVFKDAPRALRLKVVDKIPDLIKALVEESEKMAADTTLTVARAMEIASSLPKPAPNAIGTLSQLKGM
jgi:hypothetical protein